jgi:hypothetical protein
LVPRGRHEGLRSQVVDLIGLSGPNRLEKGILIERVSGNRVDPILYVLQALETGRAASAQDAEDFVALFQEKLGQVGSVLTRDARDERSFSSHRFRSSF